MTLVAPLKPPAHHKKNTGRHHRHSKTYHKPYWPYLPIVGIVIAGILLSNVSWLPGHGSVLGYATDMSIQELLDDTNQQRIGNGEAALGLNSLLDNAAQSKANDMAARDYWSHNTPDGQTPWTFITAAGYNYQLAGENLAYGFDTAADTLTGWMNSPEHRANILNGGYTEVGFGYINIANYQGTGPETLVVAMYASPASTPAPAAAAPPPAPSTPAPTQTATQQSSGGSAASGSGGADTQPTQASDPTPTPNSNPANSTDIVVPSNTQLKNVQEPEQQHVSRTQLLTAGKAPWSGLAVALIGTGAIALFLLRHGIAWHKVIKRGEQLILHHPLLDMLFVALAVLAVVLSHSAGVIR
ncbi:MAG TPA: CAP domain-containing protein [Candidatus Microsaccharimonas sp.]|nr:CAP domain-containing protein [Candidatus Microsaccharimonas sp.]